AADERVALEPVFVRQSPLLRGQQRQNGRQRVEAKVASLGNPDAAGLRQLEVVADGEAAHRASLDPLDRDPKVEYAHLCQWTISVAKPTTVRRRRITAPTS